MYLHCKIHNADYSTDYSKDCPFCMTSKLDEELRKGAYAEKPKGDYLK